MNASESNSSEKPEPRDVTSFLRTLLLGGALAMAAPRAEAAHSTPKVESAPPSDLTLRLTKVRALLEGHQQNGPAAIIPGSPETGAPDMLWWRNWGNWHPGWGNFHRDWGNGGWGNGGWHNWHNWRNF